MSEQTLPPDSNELVYPVKGEKLVDYIAAEAALRAERVLQQRAERHTKVFSIVLSVFAFLGLGGVFGIVKYAAEAEARRSMETHLPSIIDARARTLVDEQSKAIRTQLQDELLLSNFTVAADALDAEASKGDSFSDATRDDVMNHFRAVATKAELTSRASFKTAIAKIVDHFSSADQRPQLDEIHELASKVTLSMNRCVLDMAMHYGRVVVGSAYSLGSLKQQKEVLDKYLSACEAQKWPEVSLFWRILLEFDANQCQRSVVTDNLVRASRDLRRTDARSFYTLIRGTSDAKRMAKRPTQEILELERVTKEFIRLYANELDPVELQRSEAIEKPDEQPLVPKVE